ncbi:30S ribosomal protein S18 [bacterium]|jgi:small subunit ribosomal protein S18|nr:30S ribosomal protein S18 [bacterium]MBT4648900.1 30S ribosomal protein S18 [bacterium]
MHTKLKNKYCYFCVNNVDEIDYKNWQQLQRFTSSYGKIVPKRRSGVCSKHQRKVAQGIKRARFMAFLPYISK